MLNLTFAYHLSGVVVTLKEDNDYSMAVTAKWHC